MCQKSEEQENSLDGLIFLSYHYLAKWIIQENTKYYDDILNRY